MKTYKRFYITLAIGAAITILLLVFHDFICDVNMNLWCFVKCCLPCIGVASCAVYALPELSEDIDESKRKKR